MMNKILNWLIILLPLALPLYVVRFNIGPLPTTLLEVYVLALIVTRLLTIVKRQTSSLLSRKEGSNVKRGWMVGVRSSWFAIRSSLGGWFWPLVVWLAVTLVAVFVAEDSWAAFGHWRAFVLEPVMVFVVLLDTLARESPNPSHGDGYPSLTRGLLTSVAIVTILLGVYAIFQYFTGWGIPSPWDDEIGRRATGVFGYPNGLSLFIVPFGIVSLIKLMDGTNYSALGGSALGCESGRITNSKSILFLLATLCAGIGVVLAKSMGGILAFGVGVVLTLIMYKKTRVIGIILTVLGILGAGLVAWQIYGTELHPSTIEDSLASTKKWSSSVRVIIWQESWELIKDNAFFGTGLRSYKTAILPYHQATWMEVFPHPHNIFLMLWIETGLPGLIAFLWLIGAWVIAVKCRTSNVERRKNAEDLIWLVPLAVILVHGMVDLPYFKNDLAIQFFLLAALATHYGTNYHRPWRDPAYIKYIK